MGLLYGRTGRLTAENGGFGPGQLVDAHGQLDPAARSARERGVYFCLGHGQGSFSWTVAEKAAAAGFFPDSLSTDLHIASLNGPAYDMPSCMTKYLMMGMPLDEVVRASTVIPAKMLGNGWADKIGTLGVGRCADITALKLETVDAMLEDSIGQLRHCSSRLVCHAVWREGMPCRVTFEQNWPNLESAAWGSQRWPEISEPKDNAPPPPTDPAVAARVEARQGHLKYLALAAARMGGDCTNSNIPIYLSPAAIGHMTKWAVLPWCKDAVAVAGLADRATEDVPALEGGTVQSLGDQTSEDRRPVIMARRQLLAFAEPEQQEHLRRQIMYGCC